MAPDLILPASMASFGEGGAYGALMSYDQQQQHISDSGPDTVEIVAVVTKLDPARLRVLSHQFSMSAPDIQSRFNDVQIALFDEMEQEQMLQQQEQLSEVQEEQLSDVQQKELTFQHEVTPDMLATPNRGDEEASFLSKLSFKMKMHNTNCDTTDETASEIPQSPAVC